mmetsp:Transcript_53762/g.172334  ORF Transcript_53762/g.172334 Transcript_53762/m.172334 type:complete len:238 (+) Transcript_53762:393-1106(+)
MLLGKPPPGNARVAVQLPPPSRLQRRTVPSREPVAARSPGRSAAMASTASVWPRRCAVQTPVVRSQASSTPPFAPRSMRMVSALKAREVTPPGPATVCSTSPVTRSRAETLPSSWPHSTLSPEPPKATAVTRLMRWPGAALSTAGLLPSSRGPQAARAPSKETAKARAPRRACRSPVLSSTKRETGPVAISPCSFQARTARESAPLGTCASVSVCSSSSAGILASGPPSLVPFRNAQ